MIDETHVRVSRSGASWLAFARERRSSIIDKPNETRDLVIRRLRLRSSMAIYHHSIAS